MMKKRRVNLTFGDLRPFFQIRKADIPIRMYRVVQTGPKSHEGGVKGGFFSAAYQFGMDVAVKMEPSRPTERHKPQERTILRGSASFMI